MSIGKIDKSSILSHINYMLYTPPLISIVAPVINPSYSEARYKTARATSAALPALWIGMPAVVLSADSFVVCVSWNDVPSISPGATALTRVPCGPNSADSALVKV